MFFIQLCFGKICLMILEEHSWLQLHILEQRFFSILEVFLIGTLERLQPFGSAVLSPENRLA
jgi:hypothetical protein